MSTFHLSSYHHGNLRSVMLEVAMGILERDGEQGVGLRDLARLVGVSPAAPYRHFDSRNSLLEALAITGFHRFSARMAKVAEEHPDNPLSAMGKTYVLFALENANLFRLMFSPQLTKIARPGLKMASDTAFDSLRQVIGGDDEFDRVKALSAWAKVHGLAMLLLDGQVKVETPEETKALIADVLASL
ncbi:MULTISPECIES: TetR/AcrR family transcriptional regulator [unclassified Devosia]|uniref:TetR/AcrR family transcriptional regulator n=1 Tax=unclassified Devosia TaxID=196773 RepID=UPI00145F0F7A|nr:MULTISPECIES: TetR/AcrR family transcriptional regulator [unclassified Devosia]MBJ6988552.1 TetR/AcrR family transcriptional regulator [Devosia sp. MC521]MBJ7577215.1 TetR/AcrR family transcriptional regulator [Devosia sp. MC532]QMW62644.1 TetR/AcrR family transcriptional regulator [Devosia sp. MC521]